MCETWGGLSLPAWAGAAAVSVHVHMHRQFPSPQGISQEMQEGLQASPIPACLPVPGRLEQSLLCWAGRSKPRPAPPWSLFGSGAQLANRFYLTPVFVPVRDGPHIFEQTGKSGASLV